MACAELDCVAGQPDHSLNQGIIAALGSTVENYNLAMLQRKRRVAARFGGMRGADNDVRPQRVELTYKHALAFMKRRLHADLMNLETTNQRRQDQKQHQRLNERPGQVPDG